MSEPQSPLLPDSLLGTPVHTPTPTKQKPISMSAKLRSKFRLAHPESPPKSVSAEAQLPSGHRALANARKKLHEHHQRLGTLSEKCDGDEVDAISRFLGMGPANELVTRDGVVVRDEARKALSKFVAKVKIMKDEASGEASLMYEICDLEARVHRMFKSFARCFEAEGSKASRADEDDLESEEEEEEEERDEEEENGDEEDASIRAAFERVANPSPALGRKRRLVSQNESDDADLETRKRNRDSDYSGSSGSDRRRKRKRVPKKSHRSSKRRREEDDDEEDDDDEEEHRGGDGGNSSQEDDGDETAGRAPQPLRRHTVRDPEEEMRERVNSHPMPPGMKPMNLSEWIEAGKGKNKLTRAQSAMIFVLAMLKMHKTKRWKRYVCRRQLTETVEQHDTRHYNQWKTVEDFIRDECTNSKVFAQFWVHLSLPGVFTTVLKYIADTRNDDEFPVFSKDRTVFAFDNGIYSAMQKYDDRTGEEISPGNHLMPYGSEDLENFPAKYGSANYIRGTVDPDWITCEDPRDIPTPVATGMLKDQKWSDEVIDIFLAMCYGRVIFPLGTYDNLQVCPFLYGIANTGKSTFLKNIAAMYARGDVYVMSNDTQGQFSLANANESFITMITEVKRNLSLPQAQFQAMVTGEAMELAKKHVQETVQANPWTIPLLMAGNEMMDYGDQAESLARRILVFSFSEIVSRVDTALDAKLLAELPALIIKGIRLYIDFIKRVNGRGIWDEGVLPSYFHRKRVQMQAETNPLIAFMGSDAIAIRPNNTNIYMPEAEFDRAYKSFCRDKGIDMRKNHISAQTKRTLFKRNGIAINPNPDNESGNGYGARGIVTLEYPRGSKCMVPGVFLMGCDLLANVEALNSMAASTQSDSQSAQSTRDRRRAEARQLTQMRSPAVFSQAAQS
jgi:hypothetical protein